MRRLGLGALVAATVTAAIPAATAANAGAPQHCIAYAGPVGSPERRADIACYPSFSQAIAAATDGRVQLDAVVTPLDLVLLDVAVLVSTPAFATSSPLLGVEYQSGSNGGSSLSLFGTSGTGCSGGVSYGFSSMPAGWNDVISSARAFSGCTGRHYDGGAYGGNFIDCTCAAMGAMDNRTSSILFF